jgi:hypothetical protein
MKPRESQTVLDIVAGTRGLNVLYNFSNLETVLSAAVRVNCCRRYSNWPSGQLEQKDLGFQSHLRQWFPQFT